MLGGIFIYAGVVKAWDPPAFAARIHAYRLVSARPANMVAIALPWIEITAAAALVSARLRRGGLLLIIGMLAIFIVVEASVMWRGIAISCGCFSPARGSGSVGGMTLLRNTILLAAAWAAVIARPADLRKSAARAAVLSREAP